MKGLKVSVGLVGLRRPNNSLRGLTAGNHGRPSL